MPAPISSPTFLTQLAATSWTGERYVTVSGQPIWFRVYRRPGTKVIFTFQGTIDRDDTPVPVYGTDLSDDIPNATIIGVSDPALDTFPAPLGSGWYAGWQGVDLQGRLGAFFLDMIAALGATRVIFQGSSAGGFAALRYGSLVPNSIIIALNPQTNLDEYLHTTKYREACWPNLGSDPLSSVIDCDLVTKYATAGSDLTQNIVYIINEGDSHHMEEHFLPFWYALPRGKRWRLVRKTVGLGVTTHVGLAEADWVDAVKVAVAVTNPTRLVNANEIRAAMRW